MPLGDPRLLVDQIHVPAGKLRLQLSVRFHTLRQMYRDGTNGCVFHKMLSRLRQSGRYRAARLPVLPCLLQAS